MRPIRSRVFFLIAVAVLACGAAKCGPTRPVNTCRGVLEPNGYDVGAIIDQEFQGADQNKAQAIAYRESRCDPGAMNQRSGAAGLLQLLNKWGYVERACPGYPGGATRAVYDPTCNSRAARIIVNEQGWAPWN